MLLTLLACAGDGSTADDSAPDDTADLPASTDRSLAEAHAGIIGGTSDAAGNAVALVPRAEGGASVVVAAYFAAKVCVYDGGLALGTYALADAPTCWTTPSRGEFAGYSLATGPDLGGDGAGDLLVGAIGDSTQGASAGAVYVLADPAVGGQRPLGEATTILYGESGADLAGSGVAFAGDVDGDGAVDLLVGAPGSDAGGSGGGRAYLVRGPLPAGAVLLADVDTTITGEGETDGDPPPHGAPVLGDGLGVVLDGAGDLDGDGLADLALGANGNDTGGLDAGVFAIFLGPVTPGALTLAEADQLYFGAQDRYYAGDAVAAGGDLDGDGLADVLVGGGTEGPGTTWVVTGPGVPGASTITDLATSLVGEADLDYAGAVAAGAGDVDGDGAGDVVVGAYGRDAAAVDAGGLYVLRGPLGPGTHLLADAEVRWVGEAEGDYAGRAVAGGADANGDGLDDVLVGGLYSDEGGTAAGKAWLLLSE